LHRFKLRAVSLAALLTATATAMPARADSTPENQVTQTAIIAAPPSKVWNIIKNFNDWSWHPAIKGDTATNGNVPGSIRTLDLGGPKIIEELTSYDAGRMTYGYKFTDDPNNAKVVPVTQYVSVISVKPGTDSGTVVEWQGRFHRADPSPNPAPAGSDETAMKTITSIYRAGLDNLKKLAETGG
jgi:hypothetical protein